MKKFVAVMLAAAALFAAQNVLALESVNGDANVFGGSLQAQNSFGLYDQSAYDFAIQPQNMDKVQQFHLFTNLSNYESGNAYLIGTAGKVGPGSIAVFYEDSFYENKNGWKDANTITTQGTNLTLAAPRVGFTGNADNVSVTTDGADNNNKIESVSALIGYGMNFGKFSLGLNYAPSRYEDKGSSSVINNQTSVTSYADVAHTTSRTENNLDKTVDSAKFEQNVDQFNLGSRLELSEALSLEANLTYGMVDLKGSTKTVQTITQNIRTNSGNAVPNLGNGVWAGSEGPGYASDSTETITDNNFDLGNVLNNPAGILGAVNADLTGFSITVEPTYKLNDTASIAFLLGMTKESGDFDANGTSIDRLVVTASQANATDNWTYDQTEVTTSVATAEGDVDNNGFEVGPALYLTNGDVKFSLGMYFSTEELEVKGDGLVTETYTDNQVFNDNVDNTADWSTVTSTVYGQETADFKITVSQDSWRFPVATEFKLTDKLTARAGAEFRRDTVEVKANATSNNLDDNGDGTIDSFTNTTTNVAGGTSTTVSTTISGVDTQTDALGNNSSYDATTDVEKLSMYDKTTWDTTTYRLGLGYAYSDNLTFDLMFEGSQNNGGADTTEVFASAVYKF